MRLRGQGHVLHWRDFKAFVGALYLIFVFTVFRKKDNEGWEK